MLKLGLKGARGGFVAGAVLLVGACSLALDVDHNQCRVDADCAGHGLDRPVCVAGGCRAAALVVEAGTDASPDAPPEDPVWGCVGHRPPVPVDPSIPVHFPLTFGDPVQGKPRPNLPAVLCADDDPDCTNPVPGVPPTTDDKGSIDVVTYNGFKGFLRITKNDATPTLLPTYVPLRPVPDKATEEHNRHYWSIVDKDQLALISSAAAGKPAKDEYGHMLFVTMDCSWNLVAGASAKADKFTPDTVTFYTDATDTPSIAVDATSRSGAGGFLNLPPGPLEVKLRNSDARVVSTQTFDIRPGTLTVAVLAPQ